MKKTLSILMAAILMVSLGITAFAETSLFVGSIEAKLAPETKAYEIDGEKYSALFIDDATGRIIGGIPVADDGSDSGFKLISVAENGSNGKQSKMIMIAYETISSVERVKFLSPNVAAAINTIITDYNSKNNQNLSDEDLIISDIFEFDSGEGAVIPEGQKCTFAVKPGFTKDDCFAVLFKTEDGDWCALDDVRWTEDGYLEISTDRMGVFAFVTEKDPDISADPNGSDSPVTDHIESKPAPGTKEYNIDGKKYSVLFTDSVTGEITGGIPVSDDGTDSGFKLVSVADNGSSENQSDMLKSAYENISAVESVKNLSPNVAAAINTIITEYNSKNNQNLTDSDLIISDIFEANLESGFSIPEGQKFTFAVKPGFTKDDCFAVLFKTEDGDWCVLDDVRWTEDGYLEISTDRMGVFAFVTEKDADISADPNGPTSPQTGDINPINFVYIGIAVLCVAVAVYFFVKSRKVKAK